MIYILLVFNILLMVLGQILWKVGMKGYDDSFSIIGIVKLFINPYIFSGIILFVFATAIWLYILSKTELSRVYPIQSLSYAIAAIAGMIVFKEVISLYRWFGIALIILGAYFVSIR